MTSPDVLTRSQIVQRLDELQGIKEGTNLDKRVQELTKYLERGRKFNHGVVNPLPPDHIDIDNESIITPRSPAEIDRDYESWQKTLVT